MDQNLLPSGRVGNSVSTADPDLNAVPQIPPSDSVKDGPLIPTDLALSSSASSLESPGSDASREDSASEIGKGIKGGLGLLKPLILIGESPESKDIPKPTGRVSGSSTQSHANPSSVHNQAIPFAPEEEGIALTHAPMVKLSTIMSSSSTAKLANPKPKKRGGTRRR
ncbi:hypothetical protein NL676_000591 [Syzygium grande]|nr:hypothetical protein NL676_000591 [Syzygium grande]